MICVIYLYFICFSFQINIYIDLHLLVTLRVSQRLSPVDSIDWAIHTGCGSAKSSGSCLFFLKLKTKMGKRNNNKNVADAEVNATELRVQSRVESTYIDVLQLLRPKELSKDHQPVLLKDANNFMEWEQSFCAIVLPATSCTFLAQKLVCGSHLSVPSPVELDKFFRQHLNVIANWSLTDTRYVSVFKEFTASFSQVVLSTIAEGPIKHKFRQEFTADGLAGLRYLVSEFSVGARALLGAHYMKGVLTAIGKLESSSVANVSSAVTTISTTLQKYHSVLDANCNYPPCPPVDGVDVAAQVQKYVQDVVLPHLRRSEETVFAAWIASSLPSQMVQVTREVTRQLNTPDVEYSLQQLIKALSDESYIRHLQSSTQSKDTSPFPVAASQPAGSKAKKPRRTKPPGVPDGYCWNIYTDGKCNFGARCRFNHDSIPPSSSNTEASQVAKAVSSQLQGQATVKCPVCAKAHAICCNHCKEVGHAIGVCPTRQSTDTQPMYTENLNKVADLLAKVLQDTTKQGAVLSCDEVFLLDQHVCAHDFIDDSGSPYIYVCDKSLFRPGTYNEYSSPWVLSLKARPGDELLGVGGGYIDVHSVSAKGDVLCFRNLPATYVPQLGLNLMSAVAIADIEGTRSERVGNWLNYYKDNNLQMCFKRVGRRFILHTETLSKDKNLRDRLPYAMVKQVVGPVDLDLLHARFPKPGLDLQRFSKCVNDASMLGAGHGSKDKLGHACGKCLSVVFQKPAAKRKVDSKSYLPGQKAHADCKIKSARGLHGEIGYLIIVDDASRLVTSKVLFTLKEVKRYIEEYRVKQLTQKNVRLQVFKTDCGTEFVNVDTRTNLTNKGIVTEQSPPYFKAANGLAEIHIQLVEHIVKCLMAHGGATPGWWVHALSHAVDLLNVFPLAGTEENRFMRYHGFKPSLKYFRVWFCLGYAWQSKEQYGTNSFRAIYLGTATWDYKYYKVYDLESKRVRVTPAFVSTERQFLRSTEEAELENEVNAQMRGKNPDVSREQQVMQLFNDNELRQLQQELDGSSIQQVFTPSTRHESAIQAENKDGCDSNLPSESVSVVPDEDQVNAEVSVQIDDHELITDGAPSGSPVSSSPPTEICSSVDDDLLVDGQEVLHADGSVEVITDSPVSSNTGYLPNKWVIDKLERLPVGDARRDTHLQVVWKGGATTVQDIADLKEDAPDMVQSVLHPQSSRGRPLRAPYLVSEKLSRVRQACAKVAQKKKRLQTALEKRERQSAHFEAEVNKLQQELDEICHQTTNPGDLASRLASMCAQYSPMFTSGNPGLVASASCGGNLSPFTVHTSKYRTITEALKGPRRREYSAALVKEYTALLKTKTFGFRARNKLSNSINIMRYLEVLTEKSDENNQFTSCKHRVVAQGQTQEPGVDFDPDKLYAPVAGYDSMRLLMAICAKYDLDLEAADFTSAYLQSEVKEDVYIRPIQAYIEFLQPHASDDAVVAQLKKEQLAEYRKALADAGGDPRQVVFKVQKALPGMRQSARCWNDRVHGFLVNKGFRRMHQDAGVYFRMHNGDPQIVLLFVDDLLLAGKQSTLTKIKEELDATFQVKLLGEVKHFCGMRVQRNRQEGWITLDQAAYAEDLVRQYGQYLPMNIRYSKVPMLARSVLQPATEEEQRQAVSLPYQNLVMALLFLSRVTRLDLSFTVSQLCRFMQAPGIKHWEAAVKALNYVRGTVDRGVTYTNKCKFSKLITFVDAEFATADAQSRRSFYGFIVFYAGGPVNWGVKQHVRAIGNTGATEYMSLKAAADATKSDRLKLESLGFTSELADPTQVICDNKLAVALANLECNASRTKSIDNVYHVVRDYQEMGEIYVQFGSTKYMLADFCTKALGPIRLEYLVTAAMAGPNKKPFYDILSKIF